MPRVSKYTEDSIQKALVAVQNGTSQSEACRTWGIPRASLQGRIRGSQPMRKAKETTQRLSKEQEKRLCDWAICQVQLGLPPTHQQLRELASRTVRDSGDPRPLGKNWLDGFWARNPAVKNLKGRRKVPARIDGNVDRTVRRLWRKFERAMSQQNAELGELMLQIQQLQHDYDSLSAEYEAGSDSAPNPAMLEAPGPPPPDPKEEDPSGPYGCSVRLHDVVEAKKWLARALSPASVAAASQKAGFESLCSSWQLE